MSKTELVPMSKGELTAWLHGEDISDEDISDEVNYDQALRILQAESPDAVLDDGSVVKSADLVGRTFTVLSVSWRKGTMNEGGPARYAFMACADENGERFFTSCGATKVVLQLRKYELEDWLPAQVTLEAVETGAGRRMLQLTAPAEPF